MNCKFFIFLFSIFLFGLGSYAKEALSIVTDSEVDCGIKTSQFKDNFISLAEGINLCRKYSLDEEALRCGFKLYQNNIDIGTQLCLNYSFEERECGKELLVKNTKARFDIREAVEYCRNEKKSDLDCSTDLTNIDSHMTPGSFSYSLKICKSNTYKTISCAVESSNIIYKYGFDYNIKQCKNYGDDVVKCVKNVFYLGSSFNEHVALFFDEADICKKFGEVGTSCILKHAENEYSIISLNTSKLKNALENGVKSCIKN